MWVAVELDKYGRIFRVLGPWPSQAEALAWRAYTPDPKLFWLAEIESLRLTP